MILHVELDSNCYITGEDSGIAKNRLSGLQEAVDLVAPKLIKK